jgi:hypothetical protein
MGFTLVKPSFLNAAGFFLSLFSCQKPFHRSLRSVFFESANRNLNLYHSKDTIDGFFESYDDIEMLRSRQELETAKWDCRVETLEQYIAGIANKYTR